MSWAEIVAVVVVVVVVAWFWVILAAIAHDTKMRWKELDREEGR